MATRFFRRAFRRYVAGGPLGSLVVGGAAIAAAVRLGAGDVVTSTPGTTLLYVGGVMSLAIGLGTLIPIRITGGLLSDGAQLLRFREPSAQAGRSATAHVPIAALSLLAQTQRPRDWDPELVAQVSAATVSDTPAATDIAARLLLYYRALDLGATAEARNTLQRAIELAATLATATAGRMRRSIALEAAIFESVWRRDANAAQRWLDVATGVQSIDPHGRLLATAAVAAARGSHAEATRALAQATVIARRNFFPSTTFLRLSTTERMTAPLS